MTEIRIADHVEQQTAVVREQVAMAKLPEFFHRAFTAAMGQARRRAYR